MENDEVYVPWTRSELNIAQLEPAHEGVDYELYFGDTPLYTLLKLIAQQLFAFQAYLRKYTLHVYVATLMPELFSIQRFRSTKISQVDLPL